MVSPERANLADTALLRYSRSSHRLLSFWTRRAGGQNGGAFESYCGTSVRSPGPIVDVALFLGSAIGTLLFRMCADGRWGGGTYTHQPASGASASLLRIIFEPVAVTTQVRSIDDFLSPGSIS